MVVVGTRFCGTIISTSDGRPSHGGAKHTHDAGGETRRRVARIVTRGKHKRRATHEHKETNVRTNENTVESQVRSELVEACDSGAAAA